MIHKIKSMLNDDRGVSPVIGVILMVAITVILAAVIGGFVLSLGGDLQQAPQAQLSIEKTDPGATESVKIVHGGGDTLTEADINVQSTAGSVTWPSTTSGEFNVGEEATINAGSGQITVTVIHTPSDSILVEKTLTV